jgi:bifunctional UDP-N-acetylglucosamine pyrophosphorylase/glucosamine-1-phosphate N-acetyltransferase
MKVSVIILAAGKGQRMRSQKPKVLHQVGGVPMLERVVSTAKALEPEKIYVVYGNGGQQVRQQMSHLNVEWVEQNQRLGTGHAVLQ